MKKIGCLAVGIILFLAVGVVAEVSSIPKVVEEVVEKKGLATAEITSVESVDYNDLPEQIDIDNIDETNLEIYEVGVDSEKLFVLTFGEKIEAPTPVEQKQFLTFGYSGEMSDGFLESASGVSMSADRGYVMMRGGSITGISTNLDVVNAVNSGRIEIVIYKNGEAINFGNEVSASGGVQKDYDVQSTGVVTFEAGDTISVYADGVDDAIWKDVITMIEITTN
jgi:hypothetical protein